MRTKLENLDRRLLTILLVVFVQMVGASMAIPVLPLFAQRHFEMEPQVITLLVTAFFGAQFVAGPFIGRLSDRYGRVPVLIVSQIGTLIAFIMIGLATSVWMLFAARMLDGITGGNMIVAQAYITDITPRNRRTQALGFIFAAFGLGFIFGPAIGGMLGAAFGERIPFLVAAGAATLVVLLTWRTLDETLSPEQREANRTFRKASLRPGEVVRNTPLLLILSISFGGTFGLSILQATFALFGENVLFADYDPNTVVLGIGLLLSIIGITQFLTQTFLLQRMVKRYGEAMLVLIGTLLRALSMFLFVLIIAPIMAGLGGVFFALGSGLMMPPLQSLATETVADELRGGVLGLFQSAASLSTIFGSALAGILFALEPTIPFWLGGVVFLLMTFPALVILRWSRSVSRLAPAAATVDTATD
jgi:DHA1 family tetracycline resistance protein-like MFS transporter